MTIEEMQAGFRARDEERRRRREQDAWLVKFNRMVRTSHFQVNVLRQPVHTPKW